MENKIEPTWKSTNGQYEWCLPEGHYSIIFIRGDFSYQLNIGTYRGDGWLVDFFPEYFRSFPDAERAAIKDYQERIQKKHPEKTMESCESCRFFHAPAGIGVCRRNSPVVHERNKSYGHPLKGEFPGVDKGGWCGEYQERKECNE